MKQPPMERILVIPSLFVETSSEIMDRHPAWGKLAIMSKYLDSEKDYDWVVWTDCDTFFMNHELPLAALFTREVLRTLSGHWGATNDGRVPDLIVSEDGNMLNTGFFAMRPTDWNRKFLQYAFDKEHSVFTDHPWWEQASMHFLIDMMRGPFLTSTEDSAIEASVRQPQYEFDEHVALVPQEMVNPYPREYSNTVHKHYSPGSFVIAFSGCNTYKERGMSRENCNKLYEKYAALAG